jgi:hypothetical protein
VTLPPMGLIALEIEGLTIQPKFQHRLVGAKPADAWSKDYAEIDYGQARAMILNFGPAATTAYVYLQADDSKFAEVALTYSSGGEKITLTDASYPFEFTVPLTAETARFEFSLYGRAAGGEVSQSSPVVLVR